MKVREEHIRRNEATRLANDGPERSGVQLPMGGNRQHLPTGWRLPNELDVAAALRCDLKPEAAEDVDDLVAREPTKLGHTTAALRW